MESSVYSCVRLNSGLYDDEIRDILGCYFDVGVQAGLRGQVLVDVFLASGAARELEVQNPGFAAGMSGSELLRWSCDKVGLAIDVGGLTACLVSSDYWAGSTVAAFQLRTGWMYRQIFQRESYADLRELYFAYMDFTEEECVSALKSRLESRGPKSALAELRKLNGLSQSQLAEHVGVSVRAIQHYEQHPGSINSAAGLTLYKLSLVLGCQIEDLLEV